MRTSFKLAALASASIVALSNPALAEEADAGNAKEEIVVTGTLIRGVAPAGTSPIAITSAAIAETGATTTAQIYQTVPQIGTFNDFQAPVGASNAITTNRPNLRSLPGFTTSGAAPTLVLVDGHRVVGAGITSTDPDADIVPPSLIERVEIVPDGGSAIYGSDAVAGVINFITKKNYNGVDVGGRFGFADNYKSWDLNATAGHSWNTGSAFIAYNYSQHDQLLGRDRDWVFYPNTTIAGVTATSFQCSPGGAVATGNAVFGSPSALFATTAAGGLSASAPTQCDPSDNVAIYPKERRHSLMAGLHQEVSDNLTFDVRAFYTHRYNYQDTGANLGTTNFGPGFLAAFGFLSSPLFNANKTQGPISFGETQTVYYAFGAMSIANTLSTWGITPSFTLKLGKNWQLRGLASYGESTDQFDNPQANSSSLTNAIVAGLFNPYAPALSNTAAYAAVLNNELYSRTHQRQFDARLVVDGDLLGLPGGAVKLAAGVEYRDEGFNTQNASIVPGTAANGFAGLSVNGATIIAPQAAVPLVKLSRHITSVFGELVVPLFGADNATAGLREVTLSLAGRYDSYSDVGHTFNPKIGLTWKPFDALKLRANWGKSFVAPSLAQNQLAQSTSVNFANFPFLLPTAAQVGTTINGVVIPAVNGRQQVIVLGNRPGITPETSHSWSVGADLDVPFVKGLRLNMTYWNIDFRNIIALPGFTSSSFYANFAGTPALNLAPTAQQVADLIASATVVNGVSCGGNCYNIIDARTQNLARYKVHGIDFGANYMAPTSFGSVDFAFNGTYNLSIKQQATVFSQFVDQIVTNPSSRFHFRTSLGADIGALRAQVSLNHSSGYNLFVPVGVGITQTRVSSFNVVDLFFKYDFKKEGMFKDLSLTLNINNVFDQNPPVYYNQQSLTPGTNGFANGRTIGRFVQFGIDKKF